MPGSRRVYIDQCIIRLSQICLKLLQWYTLSVFAFCFIHSNLSVSSISVHVESNPHGGKAPPFCAGTGNKHHIFGIVSKIVFNVFVLYTIVVYNYIHFVQIEQVLTMQSENVFKISHFESIL